MILIRYLIAPQSRRRRRRPYLKGVVWGRGQKNKFIVIYAHFSGTG